MNETDTPLRPEANAARLTLLVCRGCCCGTIRKHPEFDHQAQLTTFEDMGRRDHGFRVLAVDCLDVCSHSNVVVIRSRRADQSATVWLGNVLNEQATQAIGEWLSCGGPEVTPIPRNLRDLEFARDPTPKLA